MFTSSICSYPQRGHYGDNSYRGNCTGYIVKDFIESYHDGRGVFADPSIGSGTSIEVAAELGIRHFGADLHSGFNLLVDDFQSHIGEQAQLIWWHPPYADMIQYSGRQWGTQTHPYDMSTMNLRDFTEALELALFNIHDACETKGIYGVLMGNLRRAGKYYNLSSLVERVAPGRLVDEIIKVQHNCLSDQRRYAKSFVRIAHEKLLVFSKDNGNSSMFFLGVAVNRAKNMVKVTWRSAVRRVLQGQAASSLSEIYSAIEPYAAQTENQHWQAKVRQVLQDERFFVRIELGVYRLA